MKPYSYWVDQLGLEAHPEGGFFKENYRSTKQYDFDGFEGSRSVSTGIYFLLTENNFSAFHRIKSDEMWHFYAGGSLRVWMIDEQGLVAHQDIGLELEKGQLPQFTVPAGVWFASEVLAGQSYSLVGCTVAPGFDFQDFELASSEALFNEFPQHKALIERLCRQ